MSEIKSFTEGLFEILLPGSFLMVNVAVFICIAAGLPLSEQAFSSKEKWGILEAIPLLGASYVLGMVLRMLRTEIPDRVSAWCLLKIPPHLSDQNSYLKERFFYPTWMRERYTAFLPPAAREFFDELWGKHFQEPGPGGRNPNTQFFNFIKTLLLSINKDTYERLMASEAVSRFVSSSFWALLICSALLLVDICLLFALKNGEGFRLCVVLLAVYLTCLYGVVRHFRFMRCKEVAMVFDASFAHNEKIRELLKQELSKKNSQMASNPGK